MWADAVAAPKTRTRSQPNIIALRATRRTNASAATQPLDSASSSWQYDVIRHVVVCYMETLPLTEPVLLILLSLAGQAQHGYAILKDVEAMSNGRVVLS